ncbi:uncharacterized protein BYT42DRAFT_632522 [Radiomyces spectabilis]|uniref:uncharacterized protein n=1 Tax=Radiomyces spectabilis TaxID=64574 RepID=UPI0022206C2D|nr:uncharacterized protein BYT42DRAFT_632522 [Radiomyces spectabilis]KAI8384324.1 hypothetical protein BYT42DRAFT_632522 [Radiomyces spectabilis]
MPSGSSSKSDTEACAICDGDRSTKRNPIIYCDGEGCNLPVHKLCYNVDEIPEGDWFCQRCEALRMGKDVKNGSPMYLIKKPQKVACCPVQVGALRHTVKSGYFMHVECAMWNKDIKEDLEPYDIRKRPLDVDKQGLCIRCEKPNCTKRFHVTCAINYGLITPADSVPSNYSPRCGDHQSGERVAQNAKRQSSLSARRRKLLPRRMMELDSEDEEMDEDDDEEDEESDEHEAASDDEEEEDKENGEDPDSDSDDSLGLSSRKKNGKEAVKASNIPAKRRATAPHQKKSGADLNLFLSDQSSDDDMGTRRGASQRHRSNKSTSGEPSGLSFKERLEAKRKKSDIAKSVTPPATKPLAQSPSTSSPSSASSSTPLALNGTAPVKQKLPSKAHLNFPSPAVAPPRMNNNTSSPTSAAPSGIVAPVANNKKVGMPNASAITPKPPTPVIKDFDEIQNDIRANAQRWNANNNQPLTPYGTSPAAAPETSNGRNSVDYTRFNNKAHTPSTPGSRKSTEAMSDVDVKIRAKIVDLVDDVLISRASSMAPSSMEFVLSQKLTAANQENERLREELRKQSEFKKTVAEVFAGLNVRIPGTSGDNVEQLVSELRDMLQRNGPITERDRLRIAESVSGIASDSQ